MLVQLPRLTSSLREPFDIDKEYLRRKTLLQTLNKPRSSGSSLDESDLAKRIVHQWDGASPEVRQAYKQFIGAVVELIDREVQSDEFREVAFTAYRLFGKPVEEEESNLNDKSIAEKKLELQNLVGHAVSDANVKNVASLAQALYYIQPPHQSETYTNEVDGGAEFGADLVFNLPARFLVEASLDDKGFLDVESNDACASFSEGWSDVSGTKNIHSAGKFSLSWLRDACGHMVRESNSQLSRDELAMAICRFLDSDKDGEEIAGDLLDLVGDGAFETVQDLLMVRPNGYGMPF